MGLSLSLRQNVGSALQMCGFCVPIQALYRYVRAFDGDLSANMASCIFEVKLKSQVSGIEACIKYFSHCIVQ